MGSNPTLSAIHLPTYGRLLPLLGIFFLGGELAVGDEAVESEAGGKVVKQQEQHADSHTFKSYTWNLNNLNGKYHIELRDGKANSGWAWLALQSVIVAHGSSCGGSCTLKLCVCVSL